MGYSIKELLDICIELWKEEQFNHEANYSAKDTLKKIIELMDKLGENWDPILLKEVFDDCEEPFYYDIDKDEIRNHDDDDDSDEEEED